LLEQKQGIWKKLLIGTLLIAAAAATATAVASLNEVNRVVSAFRHSQTISGLDRVLAQADSGKPQTILLIGSDQRAKSSRDARINGTVSRSDTMMLVRLDPHKRATALMSLPRDLKVQIPGHGTDKLNAAYAIGGAKLTVETIKNFTGLRINHVINVDFRGFRSAVDKIGCVWTDVDRHYFNQNSGFGGYATINIQAGYQKLCGGPALAYVRYRHEDNDIVRGARQQGFLRQAKDQLGVGKLFSHRKQLLDIFAQYTSSDIHSRTAVLRLLNLVIQSAGHPFVQIHFKSTLGPSYVTASNDDVVSSTEAFLGVQGPKGPLKPKTKHKRRSRQSTGLISVGPQGKEQALSLVAHGARGLRIFYPRQRMPGDMFVSPPRAYKVAVSGRLYNAYRIVVKANGIGDYWGVQGMQWTNPPILRESSTTKTIGNRKYYIYSDGANVRLVAWKTKDAVYWVSNTLEQTLSRSQMLAIAKSCRAL
jgi:polyisoprenyl-teichoic acid--peptidoglycan teichoic acid transferase